MSVVELPSVLLNDKMNNVEIPDVDMNKYTVGRNNKTVVGNKKTCDVDVNETTKKFVLGVVSDVEVPGVLLIGKMNNVEVPDAGMNKKTVGSKNKTVEGKNKTCGVDVPEAARKFAFGVVSDVEVPGVLLIGKMNNVEIPDVGMKK